MNLSETGVEKRWIVFVTRFNPLPLNRGHHMRMWQMTQYLRRLYRVGVCFYGQFPGIGDLAPHFDAIWTCDRPCPPSKLHLFSWLRHTWTEWRDERTAKARYEDALESYGHIPRMEYPVYAPVAMQRIFEQHQPIAVICEYLWSSVPALVVARHIGIMGIIDTIDLYALRRQAEQRAGFAPQYDISEQDEIALLSLADVLMAIQENERRWFAENVPAARAILAEHPFTEKSIGDRPQKDDMLLFVGSASKYNADSCLAFIRQQWPRVREHRADVELHICGGVCDLLPADIHLTSGIYCHGVVADLAEFYAAATVVINPLLYGSGLKIKTVEALGHGKCLVTTPVGADGLEDLAGRAFLMCPPEGMAEALLAVLSDGLRRKDFEQAAIELAHSRLTPEVCFHDLCGILSHMGADSGAVASTMKRA